MALQGSVLLVSAELGGAAVALFVTSRTLTSLVRQVVFTANNALWPHLTALEAIGDYRRLQSLHHLLVAGSSALATAVGAGLWFVGDEVIAGWTGGRLAPDTILLPTGWSCDKPAVGRIVSGARRPPVHPAIALVARLGEGRRRLRCCLPARTPDRLEGGQVGARGRCWPSRPPDGPGS